VFVLRQLRRKGEAMTPFKEAWAAFIADCMREESTNPNKSEDGGRLLMETISWRLRGPDGDRLRDFVAAHPQEMLDELVANMKGAKR